MKCEQNKTIKSGKTLNRGGLHISGRNNDKHFSSTHKKKKQNTPNYTQKKQKKKKQPQKTAGVSAPVCNTSVHGSSGLLFIIRVYAVYHLAGFPTSNTSRVQLCYGFIRDGWLNTAAVPILAFAAPVRVRARPGTVASTPSVSTGTTFFSFFKD